MLNKVLINSPQKIAEAFNSYFVNVGHDIACKIPKAKYSYKSYLRNRIQNSVFLYPTTEREITTVINEF